MAVDSEIVRDRARAVLRIATGLLFAQHGAQKLLGWWGGIGGAGATADPGTLMWFAGVLELFGGPLISLGLLTRPIAAILTLEMIFAMALRHWPRGPIPIANGGELASLYFFLFAFFAAVGPGAWSLDRWIRRRRRGPEPVPATRADDRPGSRFRRPLGSS